MCGYPCYGCTMTTTEQQPRKTMADYVAQYGSSNVRPLTDVVDIDTRMTMALAGINAIIDHKHGDAVAEANAAVAEIQDEILITLPEPEAPEFQPHPVLKSAGDLIQVRGWWKGDFEEQTGGAICALGAIKRVTAGDAQLEADAVRELLNRIAAETGEPYSVPGWNDSRGSVADIVRLLY